MSPTIFRPAALSEAVASVRAGGVAVFPTETVYGIGANAFDDRACRKVFEIKGRPANNPLIVHVASVQQLTNTVQGVPVWAAHLMRVFWPGPLTLVLEKHPAVSSVATAGLPTVGVRMPNHPVALEFLRLVEVPIAAPSANRFMGISPTRTEHLDWMNVGTDESIPVLDGGTCTFGIESTIVGESNGRPVLLRHGAISLEAISGVLGGGFGESLDTPVSPPIAAPGQHPRHYAPRTKLLLESSAPPESWRRRMALFCLQASHEDRAQYAAVRELSTHGDLEEAAGEFYHALWELDRMGFEAIVARAFPDEGLGRSLNDRLRRASAPAPTAEKERSAP